MTHPVVPCILLAEDDENDVFVFKRALNKAGVNIPFVHVSDGQKAVAYLAGNPPFTDRAMFALPGLVISDLKMPGMDGLELLAWAKAQPELCRIPWVILSSSADRADIHSAHLLGANDYRVKPGVFDELVAIVRDLYFQWLSKATVPQTVLEPHALQTETQSP